MSASAPTGVIEILRLAPGGDGVGRASSGEVVFVAGTVPGERVEVGPTGRKSGVLHAPLLRVVHPSPERREPPCAYAANCGGCDFMHLTPEAQRHHKVALLEQALARVGGSPTRPPSIDLVTAGSTLGYRNRLRLHVDKTGQAGLLSARSHRLVAIDRCLVADPTINFAIAELARLDADSRRRLSFCEQIELRSATTPPHLAVRLFARNGVSLRADLYVPCFPPEAAVVIADSTQDRELTQRMAISDAISVRVPLAAFSQVHPAVNQKLVAAVVEAAQLRQLRTFVDAYAGAGNFTLPLLKLGLTGEAVDSSAAGILAARSCARDLGLPWTGFSVGDAQSLLEQFARSRRQFDYLVLDPPRQGAKSVLDVALRLEPRTIALVGCDPVATARDLGTLTSRGARIESLTVFDMFPETHHFETLAIVDCD